MIFSKEDLAIIVNYYQNEGFGATKIVAKMRNHNWSISSVNNVLKKYRLTGSTNRKLGSGRPKTVRTAANIAAVQERILSQEDRPGTHRSQRQIARELNVSRRSVQRIVKKDLRLTAFKKVHSLNAAQKLQRMRKAQALLQLPAERIRKVVFTDEKNIPLTAPMNAQNERVYGAGRKKEIPANRLHKERDQHSPHLMVSCGVSYQGKTRLHFIQPGLRVTANYYANTLLRNGLIPDCRQLYPDGDFILQQDSAPVHTAHLTTEFLQNENVPFWSNQEWPAKSPDANPMDYSIFGIFERLVYENAVRFDTIDQLKTAMIAAWERITLATVRRCITGHKGFRKRLQEIVNTRGEHIETML